MDIDSPLDQQERHIAYGPGVYFVIIIGLIILTAGLQNSIIDWFEKSTGELYKDYLSLASIVSISFAIGYFIKYLGIHKYTDEVIFGFEQSLNKYIIRCLKDFIKNKPVCTCRDILASEYLDIFYEFINKQEDSDIVQRALFFSYYTKYGLSMNLFSLSLLAVGIIFGLNWYSDNNYSTHNSVAYGFLIAISIAAVLVSQLKIRREILDDITRRQMYRIVYDKQSDLIKILENRFATRGDYKPTKYRSRRGILWGDDKTKKSRFIKVPGALVIIGFFLATVGISTLFVGPIFSDFKAAFPGNQTITSPIIPAETISNDTRMWYPLLVFATGIGLLILGIVLIGTRLIQEKETKNSDSPDTQ